MIIGYSPKFVKQYKRLNFELRQEIKEKIKLLDQSVNHKYLKVHKLHGLWKKCYSFSVNYKTRIIFEYKSKETIVLLSVGDHNVYK
ncbi:MAG: type II toxin-antitoxin system mRNA interferase toxin, RelE/StbE family [Candidatus Pacebacteria bacterium]|nr:type II toxin-antitoxin system mRNA interferase toxin, RelE/StbE family [Candidatus Paceibacterota bacterium]